VVEELLSLTGTGGNLSENYVRPVGVQGTEHGVS